MSETVFWSWQNDLPSKTNREFLRNALSMVVERVSEELDVEDVERVELDHDTKSSLGMVDIGQTILDKIADCAVMVADVTPIFLSENGKALPNPNVMIELGYGLHALGYERIIAILNTGYGAKIEDLPFDIRHRRILTYHLPGDADKLTRKTAQKDLIKQLISAIQTNITAVRDTKSAEEPIVGVESDPNSPGLWKAKWPTKIDGCFGNVVEMQPEFKARAWLRIIPAEYANGIPPMSMLDNLSVEAKLWAPIGTESSRKVGPCEFGYVSYRISSKEDMDSACNLAGFLDATGEVWFSSGTVFEEQRGFTVISHARLMSNWSKGLSRGMACLDALGASKRRRVIVGIDGMTDAIWRVQSGHLPSRSRKPGVLVDETKRQWSDKQNTNFLFGAWNKLRDAFSLDQMSEEDFTKYCEIRKQN